MRTGQILLAREAAQDVARLPDAYRPAVAAAIEDLARRPVDGKALRGHLDRVRSLRVGVYRILYRCDRRSKTVTVETIRHRGEAYRDAR